ncbi:MAG: hypothetical protein OEQ18_08255 [Gammaproteobacteria bacterium]|nr:hypothetical protein [Gammaproteobacteria bacterium]
MREIPAAAGPQVTADPSSHYLYFIPMRFAAAFLLVIAFVLDFLAGAGLLVLGLMGVHPLNDMLSIAGGTAGEHAAVIQAEVDRAVAGVMALEGRLDGVVDRV